MLGPRCASILSTLLLFAAPGLTPAAHAQCSSAWLPGSPAPASMINQFKVQTWDFDGPGPKEESLLAMVTLEPGATPQLMAWDGQTWTPMPGLSAAPKQLLNYSGTLLALGEFPTTDASPPDCILQWNGSTFARFDPPSGLRSLEVGKGVNDGTIWNGQLVLVTLGSVIEPGGTTLNGVIRLNGQTWTPIQASSASLGVQFIDNVSGTLVGTGSSNIAIWNGSVWSLTQPSDALGLGRPTVSGDRLHYISSGSPGGGGCGTLYVWTYSVTSSAWSSVLGASNFGCQRIDFPKTLLPAGNGFVYGAGDGLLWTPDATGRLVLDPAGTTFTGLIRSLANWRGRLTMMGGITSVQTSGQPSTPMLSPVVRDQGVWSGLPARGTDGPIQYLADDHSRIASHGTFTLFDGSPAKSGFAIQTQGGWSNLPLNFTTQGRVSSELFDSINGQLIYYLNTYVTYRNSGENYFYAKRLSGNSWTNLTTFYAPSVRYVFEHRNLAIVNMYNWGASNPTDYYYLTEDSYFPLYIQGLVGDYPSSFLGDIHSRIYVGNSTPSGYALAKASNGVLVQLAPYPPGISSDYDTKSITAGGYYTLFNFRDSIPFTTPSGPASQLLGWNGSTWFTFAGGLNGRVRAIAEYNGELYAAGEFTASIERPDIPLNRIAKWDGQHWQPLGLGLNATVNALHVDRDTLIVGGEFGRADNAPSGYLARYFDGSPLRVTKQPESLTVPGGRDAAFTAVVAGSSSQSQWTRDGVPLSDGLTPHGSKIIGSHTSTLVIESARAQDAGDYRFSVTGTCGPDVLTNPASLSVCISDLNADNATTVTDFLTFFSCFDTTNPCADIDGLPGVDFYDFLAFFNAFDAGC